MIKTKLIEVLTGLDVLKNFTAGQINDHFFKKGHARIVEYEKGERILCEGEYDNWVYWLIEGKVGVIKNGVMVASFQRIGDMFGEMSLLDGDARSACVDALTPTVCFALDMSVLDHPVFKDKISRESFCRNLAQLTSERLAKTTTRLSGAEQELVELRKLLHQKDRELEEATATIRQLTSINGKLSRRITELTEKYEWISKLIPAHLVPPSEKQK